MQNWNFTFDASQLKVINDALVQMPYWQAAPLIQSINEQIAKQQKEQQECGPTTAQ